MAEIASWLLSASTGSMPPITNASSAPALTAANISALLRPMLEGSESTPHAAATSTRAAASDTGRPPGRRFPIAPALSSCEATAAASVPGATQTKLDFNFSAAIESFVPIVVTLRPRFLTCLLMRKKTMGDSSSGSKPTSST